MNDVAELKQYAEAHARNLQIPDLHELLDRIVHDDHDKPGSWVGEWCRAGRKLEMRGRDLDAGRHYALARFPFVDSIARAEALGRSVHAVDRWRVGRGIEPLEVDLDGTPVQCWSSGLTPGGRAPLLLLTGGIVSVKEQWVPALAGLRRLGMAGIVADMPATGQNSLPYRPDSAQMISRLLDAVADRVDVTHTYAMALSFSGHMAIRCAVTDPRIRAVVTMGAPVAEFFSDPTWRRGLPKLTIDTLAHMTGSTPAAITGGALDDWALTEKELAALDIPVAYVASSRDEIIPPGDVALLRRCVRQLEVVEHDDVHGSPDHQQESRLWMIDALLRARGRRTPASVLVGLLLRSARRRAAHAGSRG